MARFKARKQVTEATDAGRFTSILDQHGSVRELSKEPGLIPSGVWLLGTISAKLLKKTRETDDGQEVEYEQFMLVSEPLEPTESVDEEAVSAVDQNGKSLYDGKRLFTKVNLDYAGAMRTLAQILEAHGYDLDEPLADTMRLVVEGSIKGRRAYGDVGTRTFKRQDGANGEDNVVKSWVSVEKMEAAEAAD